MSRGRADAGLDSRSERVPTNTPAVASYCTVRYGTVQRSSLRAAGGPIYRVDADTVGEYLYLFYASVSYGKRSYTGVAQVRRSWFSLTCWLQSV